MLSSVTYDITDEILAVMKVFKRVQGDELYVSDIRDEIKPDEKYYFECKQENHEPVKRLFTCGGGNWTAAERDPNWKRKWLEIAKSFQCSIYKTYTRRNRLNRHIELVHGKEDVQQRYTCEVYYFLGHLCLSYAVAFVVSLAFESPMMGLEKALLGRGKNS